MSEELSHPKRVSKRNTLSAEDMQRMTDGKKSYWPFLLALAMSIALFGVVLFSNPTLVVGLVLAVVAIIGWGLERH